jgi:hypothetical protein
MNLTQEAYEISDIKKEFDLNNLKLFKVIYKRKEYGEKKYFLYAKNENDVLNIIKESKYINFCDFIKHNFKIFKIEKRRGLI